MSWAVLAARLALAAVFVVAAVAKLADLRAFRESLVAFRLDGRRGRVAAVVVPTAELVTALLLLVPATARAGGVCALVLLGAFSWSILLALRRGEQPDCGCFGRVSSGPVGRSTLVRNGVLAAPAAAVVVAGSGASLAHLEIGPVWVAIATLAVGIAVLAVFGLELLRQNGRLLQQIRALEERGAPPGTTRKGGLRVGAPAPAFSLLDLDGVRRSLADMLSAGRPLAILFSDIDCAACGALPGLIERLDFLDFLDVVVVSRGSAVDNIARWGAAEYPVLVQEEREVVRAYEILVVPSAVLIDPAGWIASETAEGEQEIELLLTGAALPANLLSPVAG